MAGGAVFGLSTGRGLLMTRKRCEGKVRPIPGNSPHDRPVSRVISLSLKRVCDDPFSTAPWPSMPARTACVFQAWRNLSGPMWSKQNQTPGRDRAASRWSAPSPGSRTRREDRAPTHRPQMSSGRLFLDRVAREQSPSPLHRQPERNTHSSRAWTKGAISTLAARGHFYFALTRVNTRLRSVGSGAKLCTKLRQWDTGGRSSRTSTC